jgi:hypothetical protein
MLNKIFKIGLVTALVAASIIYSVKLFNQDYSPVPITKADVDDHQFRKVKNDAFTYGELLEYEVNYSFITAGKGYFYILPKKLYKYGRECYDIRFQVRSLESLEWIYKVRDTYSSVLDAEGLFPWEFEQHIREGNYKRDFVAYFDQVNNQAYTKKKIYNTPEYVHDIVSAFFYTRTKDLHKMRKGDVFYLNNFFDDTTYTLGVKMRGRQTVEVKAGKFDCLVIEPLVVEGGLFKSEGSILIWLTNDKRKIPVKVATKILIGYVNAELVKYDGLAGPLDAKLK